MIPGSALRRLSAITGLEAKKLGDGVFALYMEPEVALVSFLKDEKEACAALRQNNLRRVNEIIFRKQAYKCADCGERVPLQGHHVNTRARWRPSDGPLDVESNIRGLCQVCHANAHKHVAHETL